MFIITNKIRAAIAVLAAASSIAVATGPIVSPATAAPNNGGGPSGATKTCDQLHSDAKDDLAQAKKDLDANNVSAAKADMKKFEATRATAQNQGCKWAARVRVTSPYPGGIVVSGLGSSQRL